MEVTQKIDRKLRLEAFDLLLELKTKKIARKTIIEQIHVEFDIPENTLYDWYSERCQPFGRRGELKFEDDLFYVLGALLGDGCIYNWKTTNHYVILVGDEKFTKKFAEKVTKCINKKTKAYIDRSKNIWFVRVNNFKLFYLFKKIREDLSYLQNLLYNRVKEASLLFIEGLFDAEGCVKIIKEKVRKTPKICLDITNTDKRILDLAQLLLKEKLEINSNYSIQKPDGIKNKQIAYHLRVYKKEFVKKFFENINTTKLKSDKEQYLHNWLNNGKGLKITSPLHSGNFSQPVSN